MADTDTNLPIGIELPVRLVIGTGDGVIDAEVGTVTLDPGDTADKVIAEFLFKVAEEIAAQSKMALEAIDMGVMTRVEVPAGEDPRFMPGTTVVRGTPEALALLLGNAQDVNNGGVCNATPPAHGAPTLTSYSCGGGGCACQPKAS